MKLISIRKVLKANRTSLVAGLVLVLVAGVGVGLLQVSSAAVYVVTSEAEAGSLGGNYSLTSDSGVSGQAVRFGGGGAPTPNPGAPSFNRPFTATSPWYAPIPPSVQLDTNNSQIMATLSAGGSPASSLAYEFGIPAYSSAGVSGGVGVACLMDWGTCPFAGKQVPLTSAMKPHVGSDGAMVVVNPATGQSYEFWQYQWNGGSPRTSWGAIADINSDGVGGNSVGAGVSRFAGLIRLWEVQQGSIDHALVFSTSLCKNTTYRYPATKTDGKAGTANDKIEEGTRLQLDPSLNVDAIAGITPIEKMMAKAMQKYGLYAIDCGGSEIGISFELDPTATASSVGKTYSDAGLRWDYDDLPNIPWDKLRVLKTWNGQ